MTNDALDAVPYDRAPARFCYGESYSEFFRVIEKGIYDGVSAGALFSF